MSFDRITIEPGKMGGKPCIRGMRLSVSFVLKMMASGMGREQILREHADLENADIDQCLAYASILTDEETITLPLVST